MIAEPFICVEGHMLGQIIWFSMDRLVKDLPIRNSNGLWRPYAIFEREKLKALHIGSIGTLLTNDEKCVTRDAFVIDNGSRHRYESFDLIGYSWDDYQEGCESSRLLKRAEFLKAVCEKEGLEWLPTDSDDEEEDRCDHPAAKCEKCGSENTRLDFWFGHAVNHSGIECRNCGHYQKFPPVPNKTPLFNIAIDPAMPETEIRFRDLRSGGEVTLCNVKPERDYYTKAEVEERFKMFSDQLNKLAESWKANTRKK